MRQQSITQSSAGSTPPADLVPPFAELLLALEKLDRSLRALIDLAPALPGQVGPAVDRSLVGAGTAADDGHHQPPGRPTETGETAILIEANEVAGLLGISLREVRRMDSRGALPRPVKIGTRKRWMLDEIRLWVTHDLPDRDRWEALAVFHRPSIEAARSRARPARNR